MVLSSRKAHNDWKWVHSFHKRGNYNTIEETSFFSYTTIILRLLIFVLGLVSLSSLAISPNRRPKRHAA